MVRKCAVDGCERLPAAGWARCDSHVRQWLDRILGTELSHATDEIPTPECDWPVPDLKDWAPGEIGEVFGK
jgi:hypothetical protein